MQVEAASPQENVTNRAFATNALQGGAGINGAVTDPSGAVIAGATVTLRAATGEPATTARTDNSGQFVFNGLRPGRYEVRIEVPGFVSESRQIDVQPQQVARLDSTLRVGTASETVSVQASAGAINTESARVATRVLPLPSHLDSVATVTKDKIILSADTAGTLFLSKNSGKSWKTVKPVWQSKVVRLISPPEAPAPPKAVFQITTDTGAFWFSRDGNRWTEH
jgi:hypothetical protein